MIKKNKNLPNIPNNQTAPKNKFSVFIKKLFSLCLKFAKTEAFSYLFFGGLTTVVSIGVYWLCSSGLSVDGKISTFGVLISNIISWIFAATFAYVTNKIFVFKSYNIKKSYVIKEAAAFYSARIFSLIVECAWLTATVEILDMNDKISKIAAQIIVVVLNYVLSKLFIFKKEKKNGKNVKK